MMISLHESTRQDNSYIQPIAEVIVVKYEHSILLASGGDDDDTGGTGHNMPWDD